MVDYDKLKGLDHKAARTFLGDGNFGGYYERPDEDMQAIWDIAGAETRALLEGPWA
jgi:creatinine amidohydrolase